MANGQSQGLQVALIITIVLAVILAVTTFLGFNSYSSTLEEIKAAKTENTALEKQVQVLAEHQKRLTQIIGHTHDQITQSPEAPVGTEVERENPPTQPQEVQSVLGGYMLDMQQYAGGIAQKDYKSVVQAQNEEIAKLNEEIDGLQDKNSDLAAELNRLQGIANVQIQESQQARSQAEADRDAYQERFSEIHTSQRQRIEELGQRTVKLQQDAEQARTELAFRTEAYERQIQQQQNVIDNLTVRLEGYEHVNLEKPDGEIRQIDRSSKSVYITVGRGDYLPTQITFSVFSREASQIGKDSPKAKIEVIRLVEDDDHMAEARILEEDLFDPIERGDQIYNPVWYPGKQVRFALAGRYYIDQDEQSDREVVRQLIQQAGGVIDAEVPDDGTAQPVGQISYLTDFLVLGEPPDLAAEGLMAVERGARVQAELEQINKMVEDARSLGVQIMQFRQFLDYVGYRPKQRLFQANQGEAPTPTESAGRPRPSTPPTVSVGRVSGLYLRPERPEMRPYSRGTVSGLYRSNFHRELLPSSSGRVSGLYAHPIAPRPDSSGRVSGLYSSERSEIETSSDGSDGSPSGGSR